MGGIRNEEVRCQLRISGEIMALGGERVVSEENHEWFVGEGVQSDVGVTCKDEESAIETALWTSPSSR